MANPLLTKLKANDKKGLFEHTQTTVSYPTGLTPFDFRNGYKIQARDSSDKIVAEYNSLGIQGGSFVTIIGKSGTAKTTFCIQTAYNIVRNFESGFVLHYDLERATSYTRVMDLTKAPQKDIKEKYIIKQEKMTVEEIYESIYEIYETKMNNKDEFMYDTGLLNEFGEPIKLMVPTVIILDSIPTMTSKDLKEDSMQGQTEAMRMAKALKKFYGMVLNIIKEGNFIIVSINHINTKIEVNAMIKTQPQVMYLKMDESLPGGHAPVYYANTMIKFTSRDKFNKADDGFDGFLVEATLIKSRTNKAGQSTHLVYDQDNGFSNARSLYYLANQQGLVSGRNPYRYYMAYPEIKFSSKSITEVWYNNSEFRKATLDTTEPVLSLMLEKSVDFGEEPKVDYDVMCKVFEE